MCPEGVPGGCHVPGGCNIAASYAGVKFLSHFISGGDSGIYRRRPSGFHSEVQRPALRWQRIHFSARYHTGEDQARS